MKRIISSRKFKAECLKLMDEVQVRKCSIIITKRNKPIAKLVPIEQDKIQIFGKMKGTAHIIGDLIESTGKAWDVCS